MYTPLIVRSTLLGVKGNCYFGNSVTQFDDKPHCRELPYSSCRLSVAEPPVLESFYVRTRCRTRLRTSHPMYSL